MNYCLKTRFLLPYAVIILSPIFSIDLNYNTKLLVAYLKINR
jgi:hypothetical protein